MATLLDRTPDTGHPVLAGVAEVHAMLDRLHAGADRRPLAPGRHALAVGEVDRAIRRLESLKLRLVAAADREQVATAAGFSGTEAWVARQTSVTRATAAREVALATDLDDGYPATAAALEEGLVSAEHAAVIVHAGHQLPTGLSPAQRADVETALVEQARRFDPDQLRRLARRALATIEPDQAVVDAHENDQVATEEEAAHARARLVLHDNHDGTTTGHFTIPTLAAAILGKVIDTITAPRRMRHDGTAASWDWAHRRGLALAELLEHLPTDHLHPRTATTLIVTLDHATLQGAMKAAGLDTGHTLSAGEARRLACTAALLPAVLDGPSQVLDLGRQHRLFTDTQRTALAAIHTTCAADGCDRPYAWCELHHHQPWHHHGTTDLTNAVPLCHWHHQRIHDHTYHHHTQPNGTIRFTRRT